MRLSENCVLAWCVLGVCALGSIVGLGGNGLVREHNRVERVFYAGTVSDATARSSMDAYLDRAADCAQVMANEALLLLGSDCKAAEEMLSLMDKFGDDAGIDARYDAYVELQKLSDALYNSVYADIAEEGKRVNFKRAYDDFWGCDKYVRMDSYRTMASDFNNELKGFPAGAVAALLGVDELNSFGA